MGVAGNMQSMSQVLKKMIFIFQHNQWSVFTRALTEFRWKQYCNVRKGRKRGKPADYPNSKEDFTRACTALCKREMSNIKPYMCRINLVRYGIIS